MSNGKEKLEWRTNRKEFQFRCQIRKQHYFLCQIVNFLLTMCRCPRHLTDRSTSLQGAIRTQARPGLIHGIRSDGKFHSHAWGEASCPFNLCLQALADTSRWLDQIRCSSCGWGRAVRVGWESVLGAPCPLNFARYLSIVVVRFASLVTSANPLASRFLSPHGLVTNLPYELLNS